MNNSLIDNKSIFLQVQFFINLLNNEPQEVLEFSYVMQSLNL